LSTDDAIHDPTSALTIRPGNFIYKNVKGFNGVAKDARPLEFDQTYFVASCTKLVTSIAALQIVERGLIALDDPLDEHLPELTSQPIITAKGDADYTLNAATKTMTLRHLLTHSSGATYEMMTPLLAQWRSSRGETLGFAVDGDVVKAYASPRIFEAGEGWMYGTGLDWASLLISRLTKRGFEQYVDENISKPLGITSFTWHASRKPELERKLMRMSERKEDGSLAEGQTPMWPEPKCTYEAGGAGMYSNVTDYAFLLSDLLKDASKLLSPTSVELLFAPQFAPDSVAQKAMIPMGDFTWGVHTGRSGAGVVPNHALGGLITTHDIVREEYFKPKGTLTWSGMCNSIWNVNREKGLATFFATQMLPFNDEKTIMLASAFETAVWKNLAV
jgi:CubicO group peptidase (beta-lactamase class C family)